MPFNIHWVAALLVLFHPIQGGWARAAETGLTALVHVNLVPMTAEKVIPDQCVLVDGRTIAHVGPCDGIELPATAGVPLLLFIHGGYWVRCSSKDFSLVARGLVGRGVTVAVMNYSLCPKVGIAEITRQSRALIAWLHRKAAEYHADPDRIYVAGHSAGGQQVGMVLATDWPGEYGLPADLIKGGIPISGVFDLRPLPYSYLQPKLLLTHETILRQSPLFNIPGSGPPLLVMFGQKETTEFIRQSTDFLTEWQSCGLPGKLLPQAGKHHFSAIEDLHDPDSLLCEAILRFIGHGDAG